MELHGYETIPNTAFIALIGKTNEEDKLREFIDKQAYGNNRLQDMFVKSYMNDNLFLAKLEYDLACLKVIIETNKTICLASYDMLSLAKLYEESIAKDLTLIMRS